MILMVEKGIRRGICHSVFQYAKATNKHMKEYDKNNEPSYRQYWDERNNFEWIEDTPQFNEDFIKNYNGESDEEYFLEVDVQYLEKLQERKNDLSFYLKE